MGVTESKSGYVKRTGPCDLYDTTNVCEIYSCVKNVKGLKSDSASPTDTWIITFKNDTTYNDKPINKGFLKIFVNNNNKTLGKISKIKDIQLSALKYELRIYRDVIRKLVDYRICPNFIKYLDGLDTTTDKDILEKTSNKINEFYDYIGYIGNVKDKEKWFKDNKEKLIVLDKKFGRERKLERICQ